MMSKVYVKSSVLKLMVGRALSRTFCWGEVGPEKIFEPRGGEKRFLGLLGGPEACSPGKV